MIAAMGVADSPLKDRAIFVQGAPRSGTTWLVMLLATHPQIAGVEAESHLFEFGVDRLFDNYEGRDEHLRGLRTYLERDELVDMVRDLCDGVFMAMRSRVSRGGREPEFVVEKTPTSMPQASLDLRRKRECFPDGWYLHIVRDGEAVTRSLMNAPWMPDRSREHCHGMWSDCVGFTRECLGDHPRYREVRFEELVEDPAAAAGAIFDWLGVESGEEVRETARALSRERFSELGAVPAEDGPGGGVGRRARRAASAARSAVARQLGSESTAAPPDDGSALSFGFARALREQDPAALRAITTDSMSLAYRSPGGDVLARGDEARTALLEMAAEMFSSRHISERWASTSGTREWWNRGPGHPFSTMFFTGLLGDANRVDVAFALTPEEDVIAEVAMIAAGPLSGRPLRRLSGSDRRDAGKRPTRRLD